MSAEQPKGLVAGARLTNTIARDFYLILQPPLTDKGAASFPFIESIPYYLVKRRHSPRQIITPEIATPGLQHARKVMQASVIAGQIGQETTKQFFRYEQLYFGDGTTKGKRDHFMQFVAAVADHLCRDANPEILNAPKELMQVFGNTYSYSPAPVSNDVWQQIDGRFIGEPNIPN